MRHCRFHWEPIAALIATALVAAAAVNASAAEETEGPNVSRARVEAAEQVYRALAEKHVKGQSGGGIGEIERLGQWSMRIFIAQIDAVQLTAAESGGLALLHLNAEKITAKITEAHRAHVRRMDRLEKETSARMKSGKASAEEVAVARYFRLESGALLTRKALSRLESDLAIEIAPPSAAEAEPLTAAPKQMFVNISRDGGFYVDGKRLTTEQLEKALAEYAKLHGRNGAVVIRADPQTRFEVVAEVMNLCKSYRLQLSVVTSRN